MLIDVAGQQMFHFRSIADRQQVCPEILYANIGRRRTINLCAC
jgi:hypothetical protein